MPGYRFDSLQFLDVDRCCTPGIMLAYATMHSSPLREETSTHAANQRQSILFMVFRSVVSRGM